jgi:hypothetical protein
MSEEKKHEAGHEGHAHDDKAHEHKADGHDHAKGGHGHGHDDKGSKNFGLRVGMTMALLGVLLALSAALLGGSRAMVIATMIEEARASQQTQAIATKYRTTVAQLQQLHALLPADPEAFKRSEDKISELTVSADKSDLSVIRANTLTANQILNTVTPTGSDVLRFVDLADEYEKEKDASEKWQESYENLVQVYEHAEEHYEWGQLAAEFGIVLASIALLLKSRIAWGGSATLGLTAVGILAWAFMTQQSGLAKAGGEVEATKKAYEALGGDAKSEKGDEELLADIERIEKPFVEKEKNAPQKPPEHTPEHAPEHAPEHHH